MGRVTISAKVSAEFARAVGAKAEQMDTTISQILRWLLRDWLAGKIDAAPPERKEDSRREDC